MARQKNMKRRRTILKNTFELLRDDSMPRVSLQKIADKSGISKSLLQSYYPHKNKLIIEIVSTYMSTVLDALSYDKIEFKNEFVKMEVFAYIILQLGIDDKATARVLDSSIRDESSITKSLDRLNNWIDQRQLAPKLGGERAVKLGLTFIVPGIGMLFLKRNELDLDAEKIVQLMIQSYMASFAHASQEEIEQVVKDAHEIISNFDMSNLLHLLDHMFDEKE